METRSKIHFSKQLYEDFVRKNNILLHSASIRSAEVIVNRFVTYCSGNASNQLVGKLVHHGQAQKLVPIPGDDIGHIESGHEGHWNFA